MTDNLIANPLIQKLGYFWEKEGFSAYQELRDFAVSIFSNVEDARIISPDMSHYKMIDEFKLCDQAYIDNLTACLTVKLAAPDAYNDMVRIIDEYVRPDKDNQGLEYLYKECGAFLALLLELYEGVSNRQALYVSAQLTGCGESTLKKIYLARIVDLKTQLSEKFPSPMAMAALYWTLREKGINPDELKPIVEESDRSKQKLDGVISAYWRFNGKIAVHYSKKIENFLREHPLKNLPAFAKEYGVPFPMPHDDKIDSFTMFFYACFVALIEMKPEALSGLDAHFDKHLT